MNDPHPPDLAVVAALRRSGIVPVVSLPSVDVAVPLADALAAGGLQIIEITFRTAAAAEAIRRLRAERPNLLVGAGTILSSENLQAAVDSGVQFALAPGLNPEMVKRAQDCGLPFLPGVATASDVDLALRLGCRLLKFFPAAQMGGVSTIRALAAPYRHLGVEFVPTGGVSPDNLADYLSEPSVAGVGGSWLAKSDDLASGNFAVIEKRCAEAVQIARNLRGS
ncbi:MAG: bifunctional 4-hydroxy-2-oxoglutarate aldolase/2-dehydro-3-deoxy-phosphogluconate aldolase [Planctomycetales bacterium]|nr:bifunctional 4-hydroxy-2-oxoglutarate aldolase/2-dehydro-3-deoxy-phosphogluconate aldolase [Planctomycetales bacterium]